MITTITSDMYEQVGAIYGQGIATGKATFETVVPAWESWDSSHFTFGRVAYLDGKRILGWAALTPVSSRCVYGGVAEVSVYVDEKARSKGIGSYLLEALISASEENGIWSLQASIMTDNKPSIRLHLKKGFREIGYREKIGCLDGVWKDNILLERRSKIVGQ